MDVSVDSGTVSELVELTHTHKRGVSLKTLTVGTLAITAVMGLLYFVLGFPPAFDNFYEKMYFHAIGIGIAAMAAYLLIDAFQLERIEPPIDFPLAYRAFVAVVLGALGGLVYISPSFSNSLPDVGIILFTLSFVLIGDVGAALLIELLVLPRKLAGVYDQGSHSLYGYFARMFPVSAADRRAYASMGVGYWLAVTSVAGACVAGLIGFANLWVRIAGSSFLGGYISWLGLDASGFADQTLDPHSHLMALAIMGGIVAVAAVTFSVLRNDSKARVLLARLGLWVAVVGMVATTLVMAAVAFLGFAPPTLFTSGQDGANGMAGDDVVMSVIGLGAMVVVVALLADRRFWKDGLRLLVLGTWIAAMLLNVLGGFYIELNEDKFQAGMSANDAAFSTAQPMTGIFLLTVMSALLLLVDHYRIGGVYRRLITAVTAVGLLAALVGSTLWTFADPSNNGLSFGIYITGTALAYAAILLGALAIRVARTARLTLPAT